MSLIAEKFATCDPVWSDIRLEAQDIVSKETDLAAFIYQAVLSHELLEDALSHLLASKLSNREVEPQTIQRVFAEAFDKAPEISDAIRADLKAVLDRDPACQNHVTPFLYFKGFHALQSHRVANWLWSIGRTNMALFIQSRVSSLFGVDIHPAAVMGRGIMMDHATGIVIGETAVVGDDVSILHDVTLGGTGKETEDRHPKIGNGVLISVGAKVLGNIEIGECARIAAGSVVLHPVPAHCTVAGVPAKVVGCAGCDQPAREMNQLIDEKEENEE